MVNGDELNRFMHVRVQPVPCGHATSCAGPAQEILDVFSYFCELDHARTGKVSGSEIVNRKEGVRVPRVSHLSFMRVREDMRGTVRGWGAWRDRRIPLLRRSLPDMQHPNFL